MIVNSRRYGAFGATWLETALGTVASVVTAPLQLVTTTIGGITSTIQTGQMAAAQTAQAQAAAAQAAAQAAAVAEEKRAQTVKYGIMGAVGLLAVGTVGAILLKRKKG